MVKSGFYRPGEWVPVGGGNGCFIRQEGCCVGVGGGGRGGGWLVQGGCGYFSNSVGCINVVGRRFVKSDGSYRAVHIYTYTIVLIFWWWLDLGGRECIPIQ